MSTTSRKNINSGTGWGLGALAPEGCQCMMKVLQDSMSRQCADDGARGGSAEVYTTSPGYN